jgi:hypothetical protein
MSEPGPSARSHQHREDLSALSWWPIEGSALDAEWSQATLDVVGRVWRAEGSSLYWRQGTEALRDDLQDWLTLEGMEFRQVYRPDEVEQRGDDDELATWCRNLWRSAPNSVPIRSKQAAVWVLSAETRVQVDQKAGEPNEN